MTFPKLIQKKIKGFGYAFQGLALMLRDYNAKIHLPAAVLVIAAAWYFGVSKPEWLWLLWSIALMWITETFNSALEKVVDLASPDYHELAKQAKDLSAAAVLLSLFFAATVGIMVLGPYCLRLFSSF